jgi:hypothetical protein
MRLAVCASAVWMPLAELYGVLLKQLVPWIHLAGLICCQSCLKHTLNGCISSVEVQIVLLN